MYTSWQDSQTSPPLSDLATGCIRRWWSGRLPRKPPWGSYRPSGRQRRPWGSWELSQSSARSPPWALKHGTPNDYNNTKQPTKHSQHYFGPSQDNPHYTYNMQITLEIAVTHINQNIYSINHHNGMYTPKIAEFIFKSPQANRAPRMRYNKFVDGVHPDPLVTLCWAEEILGAIIHNKHNYTK